MRKVCYTSIQRASLELPGIAAATIEYYNTDGAVEKVIDLGTVTHPYRSQDFIAKLAESLGGDELGTYDTRAQAGERLKRRFDEITANGDAPATVAPAVETADTVSGVITRAEAAEKLGISRGALSKRVSRGTITAVREDGTPAEKGERTDYVIL